MRKKVIILGASLFAVILVTLLAMTWWRLGHRPFFNCIDPVSSVNPFPRGERYDGFEAAKNMDSCMGDYSDDFKMGCEEYFEQSFLYFTNCVSK